MSLRGRRQPGLKRQRPSKGWWIPAGADWDAQAAAGLCSVKGPGWGVGVTGQQVLGAGQGSLEFPSTFWFLYPLLLFESNHFPVDSSYTLCFVVVVIVGFNQQYFVIVGFNLLNVSRPLDLPVSQSSQQVPQSNPLSSLAHGCLELEPGSVPGPPCGWSRPLSPRLGSSSLFFGKIRTVRL